MVIEVISYEPVMSRPLVPLTIRLPRLVVFPLGPSLGYLHMYHSGSDQVLIVPGLPSGRRPLADFSTSSSPAAL